MTEIHAVVSDAVLLAVTLVIPLALAALAGAVVGGLLVVLLGLQDQSIATLLRAASVVVALLVFAGTMRDEVTAFTRAQWTTLSAHGQPTPAMDDP